MPSHTLLSKEDCEKILTRSMAVPSDLVSYKITKFNENASSFLGDHFRLTITYTSNNNEAQNTYFLKTTPLSNPKQLDYISEAGIFRKEVLLYENLLTELEIIGSFGPKCYLTKDDVIVLEDLKAKGFEMLDKRKFLDQEHCRSLLNTLARYHSSTLIYESQKGFKLDQKFTEEIKEACFAFSEEHPRYKWLLCSTKCIIDLFKHLNLEDVDVENIGAKFRKFVLEEMHFYTLPAKKYKNVLTHDDLWCNNLLYNDKKECLFVDFQLARYAPPGFDFLVTLYLNLDCFQIENNIDTLVDTYYSFVLDHLRKHNLNSAAFSKQEFEESLEEYRLAALTEAALYATCIYVSEDMMNKIIEDFDRYSEFTFINRSKFAVKEFYDNAQYRNRLSSILVLLVNTLINKR